jgi:3-hydroxyisobutyrate dehydrogenase
MAAGWRKVGRESSSPEAQREMSTNTTRTLALVESAIHAAIRVATLEVVAMGRKQGLSLPTLIQAINMSTAFGYMSQEVLPALQEGRAASNQRLGALLQDLDEAMALGSASKVPLLLAGTARGVLQAGVNMLGAQARVDDLAQVVGTLAGTQLADAPARASSAASPQAAGERKPVLGYVGLGPMGAALARRLLLTHEVHVLDTRPQAVQELAAQGAVAARDLPSLARACEVILLCLPTSDVVRKVLFGPGGLAEGLGPGKIVIDQTTGDPEATRAMAAQLQAAGVVLADAPVSGGPAGAAAGTVAILCGGPEALRHRIAPVLEAISPNVLYCGATGSGHIVKLVKNALGACNRLVTYEAMALAVKNGLRLADVPPIITKGPARNNTFDRILAVLSAGGQTASLRVELMVKDLTLACQLGSSVGAPMLVANAVRARFEAGANELGPDANIDEIARLFEAGAGVRFTGA